MDLKAQLSNLIQLQAVDSEIYTLNNEKDACPEKIKALESAFEEKKKNLAASEKKYLDLQKQKKERELDIASKEENIKKLQDHLFKLKTNKEYQAMFQQIQDAKADISVIEDKVLELFDLIDKAKAEIDSEKQKLQEEERASNQQKKVIEERVKEINDRLAQLDAQRKQVLPSIDQKIFAQYERILHNRDGLAIVNIANNACSGCNLSVTPQIINLIKMYEQIITCEVCNRILYIDEGS